MRLFGAFLIILFTVNICHAEFVQVSNATKRKRHAKSSQIDIEDVIRAEEDPNYFQYVNEREKQKVAERDAALYLRQERQAEREAYEKARIEYVNSQQNKVIPDESKEEELRLKEFSAWEQEQEKLRREYVANQQQRAEKQNAERMARIQQVQSQLRMPASQ